MRPMKSDYNPAAPFQTIPHASRSTGLSQSYLREGCKTGTVPHIRCGNTYHVNVPLLLQKLNEQSEHPADLSA